MAGERVEGEDVIAPLRDDMDWYDRNKDVLLQQYEGQYVAILGGRVIDHDSSFDALARRVFGSLGNRPVYMPKVERHPPQLVLRSPRVSWSTGDLNDS